MIGIFALWKDISNDFLLNYNHYCLLQRTECKHNKTQTKEQIPNLVCVVLSNSKFKLLENVITAWAKPGVPKRFWFLYNQNQIQNAKKMWLQLEQNEACQYDAITVIDTNETQLHKLCGQNQENIEVSLMMMGMLVIMILWEYI